MERQRADGRTRPDVAAPPAPAEPPIELTPREREVLDLVATGATDRQIAAALAIRPRTVEWHVANLLRKLGVETRTAAATHAIRHGLE